MGDFEGLSWVTSPLMAGTLGSLFYLLIKGLCLNRVGCLPLRLEQALRAGWTDRRTHSRRPSSSTPSSSSSASSSTALPSSTAAPSVRISLHSGIAWRELSEVSDLHLDQLTWWQAIFCSAGVSGFLALIAWYFGTPIVRKKATGSF